MQAFEYAAPKSIKEAAGLLSSTWGETEVLAGGTDLMSLMKERLHTPKLVVSLKNIEETQGVSAMGGGLRIGATATLADLVRSSAVRDNYPSLIQAAHGVNSMQMRAMGTVGGDLLQRPRCWYFRNGYGLLAMHEGKSLVPGGENQYHAILGNKGPAYFVSASSFGPALIALGAKVKLASASGERELDVADLFQTPSSADEREVAIEANEILTEIHVPAAGSNATYEIRQRKLMDWPLATASVALKMEGGKVASANVVLGHVAPTPWHTADAGKMLEGKAVSAATAEKAGEAAVSVATPLSKNKHKVQLAKVAVKRAVLKAAGMEA